MPTEPQAPDRTAPPVGPARPARPDWRADAPVPGVAPVSWWSRPCAVGVAAACVLLVATLIAVLTVRATARSAIDHNVRRSLTRLAQTLAAGVDAHDHATLTAPEQEGGRTYRRLNLPLQRVQAGNIGVRFVYTLRAVGDDLHFVLDGSLVGDADGDGVEDHSFLMDLYEDPDPAAWLALRTGRAGVSAEPYQDQWGSFLSAYAPIHAEGGMTDGVVGVDVEAGEYARRLAKVDSAAAWAMLPAVIISLLGGRLAWWTTRRACRHALEVEKHRAEAERACNAKSRLLANISHELRTPLTAIKGFVEIAYDEGAPREDRDGAMSTVRRSTEHLLALINDLLDMSKAEAGAITIEPAEVDVSDLVRSAAGPLRLRAGDKGLSFEVANEGMVATAVLIDPVRTRQVLLNLLGNAVKFTERGGVRLVVSDDGRALRFRVEDTGPGMTTAQVGGLFRAFAQVGGDAATRSEGTGLGLALSRHLARLMGGDIGVQSEPGVGSAFTATIPYAPAPGAGLDATAPGEIGSAVTANGGGDGGAAVAGPLAGCRVLLAEDGEDNRRLIRFILTRAGALVEEHADGRSALDAVLGSRRAGMPVALVLTDWDMPVLDGEGLVRGLREAGWRGPVVSLTAHAMGEQERACLGAGCDAHLTKPIDWSLLVETCARLIGERDGRRAA